MLPKNVFPVLLSIGILIVTGFLPVVQGWASEDVEKSRYDIIPGPYRDLSGLVEDLIAETSDMTDTDGDTIPDSVELVIGTDPESNDTDNDGLTDDSEVDLNTDPHKMDSNNDGLPDSLEMEGNTNVDGDHVSNAWDSDNDNDGLEDSTDLSPFSRTGTRSSFHLDLNTSGEETYISFQIRPQNTMHMSMMMGSYDWPYDDKAMMKDLDNSTDDMFINPIMTIRMNDVPDQEDVVDYGIVVDEDKCMVPLFPETEFGKIVALRGKMFIPEGEPTELDLELSFDWSVTGNSDQPVSSIKCPNAKYLTSYGSEIPKANSTTVSDHQGFVLEPLGEGKVALKTMDRRYLGIDNSNKLTAGWTSLEEECEFEIIEVEDKVAIKTYLDSALKMMEDGSIGASMIPDLANMLFTMEDAGIRTQMINLIRYPESFSIVGLEVSEKFGTDLNVLYGPDLNELLMSGVVLSRDFLRNNTHGISEMESVLASHNLTLDSITGSYEHTDLALLDSINRVSEEALSYLPSGKILPIITLMEDRSANLDLDDLSSTGGNTFSFDMGSEPTIKSRMMKLTWYNTPSPTPLQPGELIEEVVSWNLNRDLGTDTASFLLFLAVGDSTVMSAGSEVTNWDVPEVNLDAYTIGMNIFNTAKWIVGAPFAIMGAFKDILEIGAKIDILAKAGSYIGDGLKSIVTALKCVKIVDTAKDVLKFLDTIGPILDMVGLIIDYAIGVFNLIMICCSNGWDAFSASVATAQFMISMAYSIVMFLIGLIPIVGTIVGIIMLIADLVDLILTWIPGVSGYQDIIMNWILGLVAGARTFCDLDLEIVSTEMNMNDIDGNGLDAGDRFELESIVNTSVVKTRWGGKEDVDEGYIEPRYVIYVPSRPKEVGFSGMKYSNRNLYQEIVTETKTDDRKDTQWRIGGTVEPGFGMVNYPISTYFTTDYKVFYEEYNYVAFWFPGLWERKNITDGDYTKMETLYFDIMPENMDDLAKWGYLKRSDYDGDSINNTDETTTSPYSWDSDGDGLGDSYELQMGYDPTDPDTDLDGLHDRLEEKKGMDLSNNDTDNDGLLDYLELEGWVVNFTYEGKEFYWHIVSDPTMNDTDGDGMNDLMEFYCNLNPLSNDTNGDGTIDMLRDYITYDIVRDEVIGDDESRKFAECNELAVDTDGNFYIKGYSDDTLLKISSRGYYRWAKKFSQWNDAYLDEVESVFVGPNGTVYVGTYGWDGDIIVYLLNASNGNIKAQWYSNYIGEVSTMWVDDHDNVYTMGIGPGEYPYLVIFDPNGTVIDYRQLPSSGAGGVGSISGNSIAVNSFGDIFLVDNKNREVEVYYPDLTDNFTWQATQFGKPCDIFIDAHDNIYICDEDQTYDRIQVFDRNRRLLSEWNTELTETCIYVGEDDKIYVGGNTGSGTYKGRIISFDMVTTLHRVSEDLLAEDTDEDGLPDDVEKVGWTCNSTTPDGEESRQVFSSPKLFDTDNDGLNDSFEMELETDPNSTDTDRDGLSDPYELENGTDPLNFDTDGDRLSDYIELQYGSDPEIQDTDADGLDDWWEFKLRTNPRDPDTDDDGLNDYDEKTMGYDPLDPDPDGDSLFDGDEFDLGSGAYRSDNDGDGLMDGKEIMFNTDPTSADSDGDLLPDGFELDMKLDPINNDTDGDGLIDSRELEIGYSPFSADSDGDGIPDSADMDFTIDLDNITMISDGTEESEELMRDLVSSGSVEGIDLTPQEGRGNMNPFIVIVGQPSTENGTAGRLIMDLLSDHPDLLEAMNESLESRFVIRYGVWSPNQTVILLSQPLENDHNRILGMFRSVMITVETGHVMADYLSPVGFVNLDSFDLTRSVDAAVFCQFDDNSTPSVELRSLVEAPLPMNGTNGIPVEMIPMGRFIEVNLTGNISLDSTILRIYYRTADLDVNGDGDADDEGDLDESTLRLFRIENGTWIDISSMMTINTTDQEVNGIPYAGYVSADLDHFSVFGLAGRGFEIGTYELDIGPIMDENGLIVENASVTISFDGFMNSSLTDTAGNTVFVISRAVSDIPVTISISKEGYHDLNHTTNITSGGILEQQPPRLRIVQEVIENVTEYFFLRMGPIINSTGDPVQGCSVRIEIGNGSFDGSTDALGEVSFNLSEDLLGSDIHIILSKEGYRNLYHNTSVSMEGTLETELPEMVMKVTDQPVEKPDEKEEKEESDIDWIIVLVLIVLLVIVAAVVIISRRNRSEIDEE